MTTAEVSGVALVYRYGDAEYMISRPGHYLTI